MSLTFIASNSNHCANSSNSKWSRADVDLARYSLAIASAILCVAAVILLVYKKLYSSFNYRLILYLLIASIINSVIDTLQMPFLWHCPEDLNKKAGLRDFCQTLGYLEMYCSWNLLLTIFFISVEVFAMFVYKHQLTNLEIPCLVICFLLPCFIAAVPFFTRSYDLVDHFCGPRLYRNEQDLDWALLYVWYVPGLIIAGVSAILIIVAILKLAYQLYQMRTLDNPERERLLNHDQENYSKALKESIPLVGYSVTWLVLLLTDILSLSSSGSKAVGVIRYISDTMQGFMGGISAGMFFIHFCVKFFCLKKRSRQEQEDLSKPINIFSSNGGDQSTYYTASAEDQAEGST